MTFCPCSVRVPSVFRPCSVRVPSVFRPCSVRVPSVFRPCSVRVSTMSNLSSASENIAWLLNEQAAAQPRAAAIYFPEARDRFGRVAYTHLTFQQLQERSDFFAWGMRDIGVCPGQKALLMIRPSLDFYALLFAIFKI